MRSKRNNTQKLLNLSFKVPKRTKTLLPLAIVLGLVVFSIVCPVSIKPSALFATNKPTLASDAAQLAATTAALTEQLAALTVAHETLKKNYLELRDRYDEAVVSKRTLFETNEKYLEQQKVLLDKVDELDGMNQYLCERLATQEKKYNDLEFTVESYLDDYKKYLQEQHDRALVEYQQQVRAQYDPGAEPTKKRYREYFFNSYDKK